ncbi:MAG TPA: PEP-CTERM sorting domain-containing protein [Candidatus Acidoferrales bacterium]|nr:PEP-CTERM sorting domain-containing protein [Candidatus Acidoferrales bacterium]
MRKSLWVLSLLLVASGAPPAHADSFTITLHDGTSSTVDGTGSFNFSGGTFSDFTITMFPGTVNAITFDMTSAANSAPVEFHACDGGLSISVFTYLTNADCQKGGTFPGAAWSYAGQDTNPAVLDFSGFNDPISASATGPHLGGQFDGDFVVTEPEPSVMLLLSTALFALAFLVRKRNVHALK